jgi:hypothetical protein
MPNNKLGDLRRSTVVMTYGPGAIVDFRAGSAPVSALAAGLEEWDRRAKPPGLLNEQTVFEPRLQKQLNVAGFRLPPVVVDDSDDDPAISLVGVRFPDWLQCPECHVLKPANKWNRDPGDAARVCGRCSEKAPGHRPVYAVPVRFVTACEAGHVDDFDWHFWVGHKSTCSWGGELSLKSDGPGLAGLILRCAQCGASRSMEGVFGKDALQHCKCKGRRPWLAAPPQACANVPRTLQRGASNLYFPVIHSALDIPPWSDHVQKMLGQYWAPICEVKDPVQRATFIQHLMPVLGDIGMSPADLSKLVEKRLSILAGVNAENLRWDEYLQFTSDVSVQPDENTEFEIRPSEVSDSLAPHVDRIVKAVRLREVRAISEFTRIEPPIMATPNGPVRLAAVQVTRHNWLPAIEVRGEGIFLTLSEQELFHWESQQGVTARAHDVHRRYAADWRARSGQQGDPPRTITPRLLLIHTLAHVVMRQLALECGYSSASLRERLYVGTQPTPMSGFLIYTATSDSDGTLGGLVRQGSSKRMADLVYGAVKSAEWCSSDPLCIEGVGAIAGGYNNAACHACVLAPETSCEEFNQLLDRAMLVGTPTSPEIGFFRSWLMRQPG